MRRTAFFALLSLSVTLAVAPLQAQDQETLVIHYGTQRGSLLYNEDIYNNLVTALNEGLGRPVEVELLEFTSGPPLLEAFNSNSVDIGQTGDAPPVFAQTAGVPLYYVASQVSSGGTALLVPENSPIQSVSELAGKKVAFARGSSSHLFIIEALRANGLDYPDIEPIFLQPGEAKAAFDGGSVDAWVIWDPFLTTAIQTSNARPLFTSDELAPTRGYTLASQTFADENPEAVRIIVEQLDAGVTWTKENLEEYAAFQEEQTGVPAATWLSIYEQREISNFDWITDAVVAQQQGRADLFLEAEVIPAQLDIASVRWLPEGIDPTAERVFVNDALNTTEVAVEATAEGS